MENQHKKVIVGEASESENEDEDFTLHKKTKASVLSGEAPESDDEETISFVNLTLPMSDETASPSHSLSKSTLGVNDSLFMKKLHEKNTSLWNNLNHMIQSSALQASKQLIASDQLLIKSQMTLQTASTTIKKINSNTNEMLGILQNILTENFIPEIKID